MKQRKQKKCPKCNKPYSRESCLIRTMCGEWFCDDCDKEAKEEFKKQKIEKFDPSKWKWRNYYGYVRDTTGFNRNE